MSSEQLADGVNPLDAELAATWDVLKGYSGRDTDLGIARRFGGAAAAYSLRDIGAMNGRVVKVRRDVDGQGSDPEEDFSANQVQDGTLENWVNGKLESTLPCNVGTDFASGSFVVSNTHSAGFSGTYEFNPSNSRWEKTGSSDKYFFLDGSTWKWQYISITITASSSGEYPWTSDFTDSIYIKSAVQYSSIVFSTAAAAYSLRKVKASYSGEAVRIRRSSDDIEVDVAFDSDDKVSASSAITNVAEQGGESGQTTATTLGDFISGTDAFVHTWYDQAGSNDAVQETAANQPKIAENGALLADGIEFDGTNDRLVSSSGISVTTSTDISFNIVGESDNITSTQTMISQGSGTGQGRSWAGIFSSNFRSIIGGIAKTFGSVSSNGTQFLFSYILDESANTANAFTNSAQSGSQETVNNAEAADGNLVIGSNKEATGEFFNGHLKEMIIYLSDQSDNRFKIESNINNYYGLYNDANELTQTEWQNTGAESFSSTSTDGFSYSNSSSTSFVGVTLKDTLAFGDSVFVSFNASGVTHPDSSDQSPQIRLRDSVSGGDGASDIIQVTNGFNAHTLTYSISKSNGDNIVFSEGDTVGGTVTISDFKVSRIARNGLAETWYDQSANLRDAIQETATSQPKIVSNGGIVKVNSKPAITFDGNDNFLEVDGSGSSVAYSFSPSGDMGMFIVSKQFTGNVVDSRDGAGDGIFLQQASADTTRFRYNGDGSIDITATRDAQHFSTMTLDGSALSASVDGGTASTDTVTAGVSTTSNLVIGKAFSGNNSNFVDGEIQEAIFYENNKTSEKSDIETDIDNFYSIT